MNAVKLSSRKRTAWVLF